MSDERGGVIFPVLDWNVYVEVIWYVAFEDADLIAMVFREPKNGPWQLRYRFRHYKDDKTWDSQDTKSVYDVTAPADWEKPRDRLVSLVDMMLASGEIVVGEPLEKTRIVVKGDGEKAGELLMKQRFAHTKSAGSYLSSDPKRPH